MKNANALSPEYIKQMVKERVADERAFTACMGLLVGALPYATFDAALKAPGASLYRRAKLRRLRRMKPIKQHGDEIVRQSGG
jgi:hypothetical protein